MNFLLKNNRGRDTSLNFVIFVDWSDLNVDGWVVVDLERDSYLGLAEILSMCIVHCFG